MTLDFITRVDPGGIYIDVSRPAYGAVGDGVTDDTVAVQAAVDAAKVIGGVVFFPLGIFNVTSTLTYIGASAGSISLRGSGNPFGTLVGTQIRWNGSVGGTLLSFKGANNSSIRDISFNGNGLALKTVVIDYDSVGGVGSSGVSLTNVSITGATGTGSADLTLGTSTTQASEVRIYNLSLSGYGSPSTADHGIVMNTANAKNFLICGLSALNYKVSAIKWGGSGSLTLIQPVFALNALDIDRGWIFGTGALMVINGESESGGMFLQGANSGNPGSTTIDGLYWSGITASDDYVIKDAAMLTLRNSEFYNLRTGSSVPKIQILANDVSPGMLISEGCTYQNATDHAPVYDSSNNDIFATYVTSNAGKWRIRSFGDIGGNVGTLWPKLRPWILDYQAVTYRGGNTVGSATLASAAFATVTLGTAEPDASYKVLVTGNANETFFVSNLTITTFRINSSNITSTAVVNWMLMR